MNALTLVPEDRLLVLAPHPDDESLACGGLIRYACNLGAEIHVVFATDGDNNPWPQRMAEHRWRLDAQAGRRWAAIRVDEAGHALAHLGVAAEDIEYLHWHDQGLTDLLIAEPERATERIRDIVERFRPTVVACPSVFDTHPDHSAAGLLFRAALCGADAPSRVYAYRVHGPERVGEGMAAGLVLDRDTFERKRDAVLCHASQTLFGRSRLLRMARPYEQFYERGNTEKPAHGAAWHWRFRSAWPLTSHCFRRLLLFGTSAEGEVRSAAIDLSDAASCEDVRIVVADTRTVEIEMASPWLGTQWLMAKLDHRHRFNTYDLFGWSEGSHVPVASAQPPV